MSLKLRWVGNDEIDRVAEARMLAYAPARKELPKYKDEIRTEPRSGPGDWLLAERDGVIVGTATHLPLTMWIRGGPVKCQGVGYVGTARAARRRNRQRNEPGVGSAVMFETVRMARERGYVVSALMPFRATYYEHFGYGIVERKRNWTIPLDLIPTGEFDGIRDYHDRDFDELVRCRQRMAQQTHGDIERSPAFWRNYIQHYNQEGFLFVDRPAADGPVRGWMSIQNAHADGLDSVRAMWDFGYEDHASLRRFLHSARSRTSIASPTSTCPPTFSSTCC
jgi:hypothetical protein